MSNYEKITTGMGEECGVFGAYDMDGGDVAPSVYYGLFALQHIVKHKWHSIFYLRCPCS